MRTVLLLAALAAVLPVTIDASTPKEKEASHSVPASQGQSASGVTSAVERYQLVNVPGHNGSPFLLDTVTGCVWHQVQSQETKRTTFVEVDVENLHWSWGSGAQQILATRVDGATIPDDQKRVLKEGLQKTACGLSSVVLTPGPATPSPAAAPKP